jgi:signal transduction histidine kinase/CheY-like chemotaxis protein
VSVSILSLGIQHGHDVVLARRRTRQIAAMLGFETMDQTRIATAVSEIARDVFQQSGGSRVEFLLEENPTPQTFVARVRSRGHETIKHGERETGIESARRIMDQVEVAACSGPGAMICLKKALPARAPRLTARQLTEVTFRLAVHRPEDLVEEMQQQNQELLLTLEELQKRQEELRRLNFDLEDTNRGVAVLYSELDEKARRLRHADEMKTRFLSNMSHEFRTPLNSILALARLLLDRLDGDLTPEQEKQVRYILQSAESLSELVNDLLDLAKVEAGKIEVKPAYFEAAGLFGALRGMMRPLLVNEAVKLVFEDPSGIPPLYSDESKISQILRNFISNALKFTERGEVRVSAKAAPERNAVVFSVADTGIGIAPQDQERIFQEFVQLDNPVQKRAKGTGLGLPLSRKLAELLGGAVSVSSQPGAGSTFSVVIPVAYSAPEPRMELGPRRAARDPGPARVLIIDDDEVSRYLLKDPLAEARCVVLEAKGAEEGLRRAREERPSVIFLDLMMRGMRGWEVLSKLKSDPLTRAIPVVVTTSKGLGSNERRETRSAIAIFPKAEPSLYRPIAGGSRRWLRRQ